MGWYRVAERWSGGGHIAGQKIGEGYIGHLFDGVLIEPCLLNGDLWTERNISSDQNLTVRLTVSRKSL